MTALAVSIIAIALRGKSVCCIFHNPPPLYLTVVMTWHYWVLRSLLELLHKKMKCVGKVKIKTRLVSKSPCTAYKQHHIRKELYSSFHLYGHIIESLPRPQTLELHLV